MIIFSFRILRLEKQSDCIELQLPANSGRETGPRDPDHVDRPARRAPSDPYEHHRGTRQSDQTEAPHLGQHTCKRLRVCFINKQ